MILNGDHRRHWPVLKSSLTISITSLRWETGMLFQNALFWQDERDIMIRRLHARWAREATLNLHTDVGYKTMLNTFLRNVRAYGFKFFHRFGMYV